jgi:DNA-binding CsgD family transcriptional regulator
VYRFMEELVFGDTKNLCQSIQQLYTLRNLDTFGIDALSIVNQIVPSDIPLFHFTNVRTGQVEQTFLPNYEGVSPELNRVQNQVLSQERGNHPIAQHMPKTLQECHRLSDFVEEKELHRMEKLYQQFLRPLGIEDQMLFFLSNVNSGKWHELIKKNTTLTGFILNRSQRNFTERDRLILNLLHPHLFQAYCNVKQYQQLQQELSQLQQSFNYLGLVILNAEGRVQSIAPQAIVWLEAYFSKPTASHQLPDHLWSWVKYQIAGLVKNPDLTKACLPLRIQQDNKELVIRLVVEQPEGQYLLLLEEKILSPLNSLALLGLSQRETEVLAWIMQGKDNKTIATHLGVNVSTVRKHLESIYSKFGVHSRTEAIAQALAKLGLLQSLPYYS